MKMVGTDNDDELTFIDAYTSQKHAYIWIGVFW